MTKTLFPLALVVLLGTVAYAQPKAEAEIAALTREVAKAMVDGNGAVLKKLTAKELSYGHSSGLVEDQATFSESLATGKSDFTRIDLEDQTISVVGNTAVVRHKLMGETISNGKTSPVAIGVLQVWQKQEGHWKLLARQAYKL